MRSIEAALTIDFFRRGGSAILLVLLAIIAIPLWVLEALDPQRLLETASKEAVVLHVTLSLVMGFGAAVAVFQSQGSIARFFVRPISATRLVACQMILGMGTAAMMYACAAGLANLWGAQWPVLGPTLFLATALACAMAMIWSLEGSILAQLLGCSATTVALTIWFSRRYGAKIIGDWNLMWHPTAADAFTLMLISALAFVVAVFGVARVRRGDVWDFSAVVRGWDQWRASASAPVCFRSPMQAQLWCEWRQKFAPAPAILLILFFLALLVDSMPVQKMLEVVIVVPSLCITLFPLGFGMVLGNCGQGSGKSVMRHVTATRPVSDSFLAAALLRNIGWSLACLWITWLAGIAMIYGFAWLMGYRDEILHASFVVRANDGVALVFLPLVSWMVTGIVAALIATGRPWLWCEVLLVVFGLFISVFVIKMYVSESTFAIVRDIALAGSGSIFLIGTLVAFVFARRWKLVSSKVATATLTVWLVAAIAIGLVGMEHEFRDFPWLLHLVGLAALAGLPLAAMPLAISWNRHR